MRHLLLLLENRRALRWLLQRARACVHQRSCSARDRLVQLRLLSDWRTGDCCVGAAVGRLHSGERRRLLRSLWSRRSLRGGSRCCSGRLSLRLRRHRDHSLLLLLLSSSSSLLLLLLLMLSQHLEWRRLQSIESRAEQHRQVISDSLSARAVAQLSRCRCC